MQLVSVWSDLYASTLALYAGRAGGHRWLVAVTPEHAQKVAETLARLDSKGEVVLLAFDGVTPLESALRAQNDAALGRGLAGVLVVGPDLTDGPAVTVPTSESPADQGGVAYREGASYPAWSDALGRTGTPGECVAASVCAALGLPVRVCAPDRVEAVLLEWWTATPHALTAG